jgi:hypothetical protein
MFMMMLSAATLAGAPVAAGAAADNPVAAKVTAAYGDAEYVNNSSRYNRYDFVLTNNSAEPDEVSVCPQDVEVLIHDHRVQSEPAFALGFGKADWSWGCVSHLLGPGESVELRTFFREWWDIEMNTARHLREVKAKTSAGVFTMRFTPAPGSWERVVQVSSAY